MVERVRPCLFFRCESLWRFGCLGLASTPPPSSPSFSSSCSSSLVPHVHLSYMHHLDQISLAWGQHPPYNLPPTPCIIISGTSWNTSAITKSASSKRSSKRSSTSRALASGAHNTLLVRRPQVSWYLLWTLWIRKARWVAREGSLQFRLVVGRNTVFHAYMH